MKTTLHTDYLGNLILRNGEPQMYRFAGGYYNYNDDGSLGDAHYYIADYLGNNRMVVNATTDEVEQENHYYAYGGLIGDLCTGQSEQEFKFGDKKLDRTYGLELYDFEARQYDAIAPWFTSIDPLAEKYYSISPYAYCAGDPVNLVDPDGRFPLKVFAKVAHKIHDEFRPLGERVSEVKENPNASDSNHRYYYDTYSYNKEDGIVITEVYSMSKDAVDVIGLAGVGMEATGVGLMCTVAAAPEGAVVSAAGAAVDKAASGLAICIDVINGDLKGGIIDGVSFAIGKGIGAGIKKLATKTATSDGIEELGEAILRHGYSTAQGAVQSAVSYSEKQKEEENEDD